MISGADAAGKNLSAYIGKPDIQYVIRPNGTDAVENSLVIGIQFIANF
jgi:carbohydrate-selective porin OprB